MDYDNKLKFLEDLLGKPKYSQSTKEAEFFCCFCSHHKPKLSINLETDNWKCWVCGKNGTRLLYVINKVGTRQDIQEYIEKYTAKEIILRKEDFDYTIEFPTDYSFILDCQDTVYGKRALQYLLHVRGLSEDDILHYKIGISKAQQGKLILPSFDARGNVNFFAYREINGGYMNPHGLPKGYKNTIVPNELNIDWKNPVVLVEGYFDMLKSVPNTIPLFGSSLDKHSFLVECIAATKTPVILALDPDALRNTLKIAKMLRSFANVSVSYIDVAPFKDVGEMSKEDFKVHLQNAKPWNEIEMLREKMRLVC